MFWKLFFYNNWVDHWHWNNDCFNLQSHEFITVWCLLNSWIAYTWANAFASVREFTMTVKCYCWADAMYFHLLTFYQCDSTCSVYWLCLFDWLTAASVENADTSFIEDAVHKLLSARRVLRSSYPYGYFLTGNMDKKAIFESMQVCNCHPNLFSCSEKFEIFANSMFCSVKPVRLPASRMSENTPHQVVFFWLGCFNTLWYWSGLESNCLCFINQWILGYHYNLNNWVVWLISQLFHFCRLRLRKPQKLFLKW